MKYAEVAVNSPGARRLSFCYSIPSQLTVAVGQAVLVPFGSRVLQGIVVGLSDFPSVEETKEIASVLSPYPLLSHAQVELALWISGYYLSPLFDAISLMLPPGFERRVVTFFQLAATSVDLAQVSLEQGQLIKLLERRGKMSLGEVEAEFGKRHADQLIQQLVRRGFVVRSQQLGKVRVRPKVVRHVKLEVSCTEAAAEAIRLKRAGACKQALVLEFLAERCQIPLAELRKSIAFSPVVLESLVNRGLVSVENVEVRRDPLAYLDIVPVSPPVLTSSQQLVWRKLQAGLVQGSRNKSPLVFLLHGVTGSGKTEVYLQALADVVARGKRGICLVPEVALTPQTIERFAARFPGRVAVFHSRLSLGEQFDEWHRIRDGGCDVVIGPRSALFAPQHELGLIIVDEEHEWTYKQSDQSPRYHVREAAIKLSEITGAAVILGSATPDVESFYRGREGEFQLLELKERITPRGFSPMPEVEIVDLREELKAGNRSLLSRSLRKAMSEVLAAGEQVILFLNRRGTATFVQCRHCGFVASCQRCSVALTYHSVGRRLVCHHCRYSAPIPEVCPQCSSSSLRFSGVGTQKVEEEVRRFFPRARLLRWDRDITTRKHAHEELLASFRAHEADVLIGTQMIAKGLDLPEVTLAGVISADTGVNLPDFRAGERTFQLLCQVAGRAGRGLVTGRVIVQTYMPEHYAIQAVVGHDYLAFYDKEIDYRYQFGYPPFSHLARLVFSHVNAVVCQREAQRMGQLFVAEIERRGMADLKVIGPVPTFVSRIRGRYQWEVVLCGVEPGKLLVDMLFPRGWTVDIDPVDLV